MEFWIMMVQIYFVTILKPSKASFDLGTCNLECEGQNLGNGRTETSIRSQLQGPPGRRGPAGSPGRKGDSGEPFCNCTNEGKVTELELTEWFY